jgi:hypothetical protein
MVAVERVVRPVRADARRKDRMREELLAHLTALYEEELARLGDEAAAREKAVQRFGDPATLTAELQDSVPARGRAAYELERWVGWRAPESAVRYTFRLAVQLFLVGFIGAALVVAILWLVEGTKPDTLQRLWIGGTFLVISFVDVFLLSLLYFKMRDALLGRMEVRRSPLRTVGFAALFALVLLASGPALAVLSLGDVTTGVELLLPQSFLIAGVGLGCALVYALLNGPAEIRHTEWECLDIGATA